MDQCSGSKVYINLACPSRSTWRSDSTARMNNPGTLKSSSSELDLDQPNIEDYLPSGSTIQQEPHGKLFLYAITFSLSCLYCYLILNISLKWKSSIFFNDLLEKKCSGTIFIFLVFFLILFQAWFTQYLSYSIWGSRCHCRCKLLQWYFICSFLVLRCQYFLSETQISNYCWY